MAKQLSYTAEQVARMTEVFDAERQAETVAELAAEFGKSTKSVVAKLSQLGLYVAKSRAKASGDRETKATRAQALAYALGGDYVRVREDLAKLRVETLAELEVLVDSYKRACKELQEQSE